MTLQTPISANDFRKQLIDEGKTLKTWAEERGYNPEYCSRVLTGLVKGNRGIGHDIAVDMGIKARPQPRS